MKKKLIFFTLFFLFTFLIFMFAGFSPKQKEDYPRIFGSTKFRHDGSVHSVAFSPDGKFILSGASDAVKLWEVPGGKEIRTFKVDGIESAALSPDGKFVIAAVSEELKLWEMATGKEVRSFKQAGKDISSLAFSPGGEYAISGTGHKHMYGAEDNTVKLWEIATGKMVKVFKGHKHDVTSVAFSSHDKFAASGSMDGTIKLWNVVTGDEVKTFDEEEPIISIAFSPDGKHILSAGRTFPMLWNVATGNVDKTFDQDVWEIYAVAFSPDGKFLVSGSSDHIIKLWDVSTGKAIRTFYGHSDNILSLAFSPDGKLLVSGSGDSTVKLWDVATGKEVEITPESHSGMVDCVAFSPDDKFVASGSTDNTIKVWNLITGRVVKTFKIPIQLSSNWVSSVVFSRDGKYILSGGVDGTVRLWEVATGKKVKIFHGFSGDAAFSSDGRSVLTRLVDDEDKEWLTLYNIDSGTKERSFKIYGDYYNYLFEFSRNGKYLLYGNRIWNISTGKKVRTLKVQPYEVRGFSPSERYVISVAYPSADEIILWEVATGKKVELSADHKKYIEIAVSPDDRFLLSGDCDGILKFWDIATGKLLKTFKNIGCPRVASFSNDGKFFVCGNYNTTLTLFKLPDL